MDGRMNRWMEGWTYGWRIGDGLLGKWVGDELVDGSIVGWMNG
jgi:hypothetical protein